MREMVMASRMSWPEIQKAYPGMWVGLVDVHWQDNDVDIESAVVQYTEKDTPVREMDSLAARGKLFECYTTPDDSHHIGMISV